MLCSNDHIMYSMATFKIYIIELQRTICTIAQIAFNYSVINILSLFTYFVHLLRGQHTYDG